MVVKSTMIQLKTFILAVTVKVKTNTKKTFKYFRKMSQQVLTKQTPSTATPITIPSRCPKTQMLLFQMVKMEVDEGNIEDYQGLNSVDSLMTISKSAAKPFLLTVAAKIVGLPILMPTSCNSFVTLTSPKFKKKI